MHVGGRSFGHGTRKQTMREEKDLQEERGEKQATCDMRASRKGPLVGARGQQEGGRRWVEESGGGDQQMQCMEYNNGAHYLCANFLRKKLMCFS